MLHLCVVIIKYLYKRLAGVLSTYIVSILVCQFMTVALGIPEDEPLPFLQNSNDEEEVDVDPGE